MKVGAAWGGLPCVPRPGNRRARGIFRGAALNDRDRLEQLRGLLDRLERMPASADRDWMLAEVRGRAVDVETGVRPASVRALPQDQAKSDTAFVATVPRKRARPQ